MSTRDRPRPSTGLCMLALTLAASLANPVSAAEPASIVYVTDELRLGLYPSEETSGRATRTLVSGTRLQVLERALRSIRVRTEEGDEGWVRTTYVVEEEPARRRLAALESLQEATQETLSAREAELESARQRLDAAERALTDARQNLESLPGLTADNAELRETLARTEVAVAPIWVGITAGLGLAVGFWLGYRWLDRRVRRQFGGVRVY